MQKELVVFLGPAGSGKGTQIKNFSQKSGYIIISPGKLLRDEIANDTELGRQVAHKISAGELVEDEIVNELVWREIRHAEMASGVILDGYPRNMAQLKKISSLFGQFNTVKAIVVDIGVDEAVKRLGGRRVCMCGASYHLTYNPPHVANICDACNKELSIRQDDKEEVIRKRFNSYKQDTLPVIHFFEENRGLIRVNGEQSIEAVWRELSNKLNFNDS